MKILIDGDACPVIYQCEKIAKEAKIEIIVFCDVNHEINLDYGKLIQVDQGRDQADYTLISYLTSQDIVITQDYALASLALAKHAYVLSFMGKHYTLDNIDELLFSRYMGQKIRRSNKKTHLKGPKKRTKQDDLNFIDALETLLKNIML